jgi:flagellar hook-associated protein FlgK
VISLDDFDTYDGGASIFYRTTEEFTSADDGIIKIPDLIDIDGDGQYLKNDIEIFDDVGNQYEDFTYEISTGVLTVQELPDTFNGNLTVNRWKTKEIAVQDGEIDFNQLPVTNPDQDDLRVFIKTIRSDVRRSTDLDNNPTGRYSMMFGKIDNGINQYGIVDEEKVNSLGDLKDMLVLDNNGILERLGYNTKVQSFLKIADFTYNVESQERDGLYGTWWLDGFVNDSNMAYTGTNIEILDDDGNVDSDFNDPVHVFYVAEELGKEVHLENGGFNLENLVDINDDQQITSSDISIRIDSNDDGTADLELTEDQFEYDSETEQIKLTIAGYENYNGTIVMDFRRWRRSQEDFSSGTFDSSNLPKTAVSLDFSGIVSQTDFRLYKEPIVNIPQEIPDPDDLKSISFTVPVEQSNGSTKNQTYNIEFYNKKELVTKINNNMNLQKYIKAFEHDGDYYISSKGSLEDISNVVVNDEYNLLSTVDLKVLNIDSYDTLNNIMYSYTEAYEGDYEFSGFDNATNTIDLSLSQNLNEYNGKIKVKYATRSNDFTINDDNGNYTVNLGTFEVKDTNQDGRIDREDIKLFNNTSGAEITDFVFDTNNRTLKLNSNPGANVDIIYWKEDSYNINGKASTPSLTTTYNLTLSENAISFEDPSSVPDVDEDFFLSVQLPPDEMQMTLGTTDIDVSLNTTTMESLIEQINNKVPAGIIADLTPDNKLVFRAGTSANFSFGKVLEDGRIVQTYELDAPTIFWEKLGFLGEDGTFGNTWRNDTDVVNNYLDANALLHNQVSSNNLNIDGRQANGLYDFTNRLELSSQIESNPLLLAVDYGRWTDLDGDWVADLHTPRGGSNVSSSSIISRLSEARYDLLINDGNTSFVDFFGTFVSEMGIEAQTAMRMTANNQTMLTQIDNERERVKGVSLDEEMSNMIKYQQAFNAAARVITAVDEMIQRIIDGLGIVGR